MTERIRAADEEDLHALVELNDVVHSIHVRHHPELYQPKPAESGLLDYFRSLLQDERHIVLVSEEGGRCLGYIVAEVQIRPAHVFGLPSRRLYVHQLSVLPDHQRRGLGSKLMEAVFEKARELDLDEVALDVWKFNEKAQRFFASLGFAVFNERMRVRLDGSHAGDSAG